MDQYDLVTALLAKMEQVEWHVVEPVRGDLRNSVWIQNRTKKLNAYAQISALDADILDEEEMIRRIQGAIDIATPS